MCRSQYWTLSLKGQTVNILGLVGQKKKIKVSFMYIYNKGEIFSHNFVVEIENLVKIKHTFL